MGLGGEVRDRPVAVLFCFFFSPHISLRLSPRSERLEQAIQILKQQRHTFLYPRFECHTYSVFFFGTNQERYFFIQFGESDMEQNI